MGSKEGIRGGGVPGGRGRREGSDAGMDWLWIRERGDHVSWTERRG